jgi:AraC family transcriptional regulator
LDVSKVTRTAIFHGLEIELHSYSGARALQVVHPSAQRIGEHRHDRAYIGIYTAGRYRERYDGGELVMAGPCAVLHPAGRPHADEVADSGLETITVEFDPAWLRRHGFSGQLDRSVAWSGGPAALAARRLAATLRDRQASESALGAATSHFLHRAFACPAPAAPAWLDRAQAALAADTPPSTRQLAGTLDLNPAWLARAYRYFSGEGLADTARRNRVEHAARLLRRTDRALAEIALEAGFCDQSHMNRCFATVLGRAPTRVRCERSLGEAG